MSNRANIETGGDGTPSQESLDSFIAYLDTPKNIEVDFRSDVLEKYRSEMESAIEARDRQAYDDAREKFDEAKRSLLDDISDAMTEVENRVKEYTDSIIGSFKKQFPEELDPICEIDIEKGTITPKLPSADPKEIVKYLENMVKAIVYPFKPIIKMMKWWPEFITKMGVYISMRIAELSDVQVIVSDKEAPPYPED